MKKTSTLFAISCVFFALVPALTGCGGAAQGAEPNLPGTGASADSRSSVSPEARDAVRRILPTVASEASQQEAPAPGLSSETYITFKDGYEASLRKSASGETVDGKIYGPNGGLPATYQITGSRAAVRYTEGTTETVTLP